MSPVFPIVGFLMTALFLWGGRILALKLGYADKPGGRKKHALPVPPIGGLVVIPVFATLTWLAGLNDILPWQLYAGLFVLLLMGAVDDAKPINPALKFTIMVWTCCFIVIAGHGQIAQVGNLFGFGIVETGIFSKPFSIMCLVLLMNSINMFDGVDGLAGGFCALVAFWMMVACAAAGQWPAFFALLILLSCLLGFLMFNLRSPFLTSAKVFLGDAGALCLGLLIGWFAIRLTQQMPASAMTPVTVIWIIAIPVIDAFALFIARSLRGLHPFHADRRHLHHRLLDAGVSPARTTLILLSVISIFALIGFYTQSRGIPAAVLFYLWMIIFIGHTMILLSARAYARSVSFLKKLAA